MAVFHQDCGRHHDTLEDDGRIDSGGWLNTAGKDLEICTALLLAWIRESSESNSNERHTGGAIALQEYIIVHTSSACVRFGRGGRKSCCLDG